jgi:hypothetical protein
VIALFLLNGSATFPLERGSEIDEFFGILESDISGKFPNGFFIDCF